VAEGAGAAGVAAAIAMAGHGGEPSRDRPTRVACVVSGGNIDSAKLATILQGSVP
jgi:threonine dehydratase